MNNERQKGGYIVRNLESDEINTATVGEGWSSQKVERLNPDCVRERRDSDVPLWVWFRTDPEVAETSIEWHPTAGEWVVLVRNGRRCFSAEQLWSIREELMRLNKNRPGGI